MTDKLQKCGSFYSHLPNRTTKHISIITTVSEINSLLFFTKLKSSEQS